MSKIFLNHSNHASEKWSKEQIEAAEVFGKVTDFPFPNIPPHLSSTEVREIVLKNLPKILNQSPAVVLCQGEFNYTFAMVEELKKNNIPAVAATSERIVLTEIQEDGTTQKISTFRFVRFREY